MLQLRSKVLKLSVSLNVIGLQIGNILDIDAPSGQSLRHSEARSDFEDGLTKSVEDKESSAEERFEHNVGSQSEGTKSTNIANTSIEGRILQIPGESPKQVQAKSTDVNLTTSELRDVDVVSHQDTFVSNEDVAMGLPFEDGRCGSQGILEFFELPQHGDTQVQSFGSAIPDELFLQTAGPMS
ncbi:hypothetical protein FPHYL_12856 [Fusarium phyllophilum]|uniref:Uncharacterized protein n=1 Tax=Fusarium phyllophilum TaxID=47803 RepID=A0A8H5IGL0_9HYPO|nr:hypothetical protein FPHYL_12856 [Fusarium phyllophilum]